MIRILGRLEPPDPPICLRVRILHSRAVGIDVEVHLCSCFREAQHCEYFVCSLAGLLDAAAGVNTKPTPVRGSGSPQDSRLIPARAGKTWVLYPGSRSEDSPWASLGITDRQNVRKWASLRLIPAREGKTFPSVSSSVPSAWAWKFPPPGSRCFDCGTRCGFEHDQLSPCRIMGTGNPCPMWDRRRIREKNTPFAIPVLGTCCGGF